MCRENLLHGRYLCGIYLQPRHKRSAFCLGRGVMLCSLPRRWQKSAAKTKVWQEGTLQVHVLFTAITVEWGLPRRWSLPKSAFQCSLPRRWQPLFLSSGFATLLSPRYVAMRYTTLSWKASAALHWFVLRCSPPTHSLGRWPKNISFCKAFLTVCKI